MTAVAQKGVLPSVTICPRARRKPKSRLRSYVVYTSNAPGDLATPPTGISIDVERVTGKRVFVPFGALPN